MTHLEETSPALDALDVLGAARWIDLSVLVFNDDPLTRTACPSGGRCGRTTGSSSRTTWRGGGSTSTPAPTSTRPRISYRRRASAPAAAEAGRITAEKVPLEQLRGPARVIDVRCLLHQADPGYSPMVQPEHILEHERLHGEIAPGDVAILWTGWDQLAAR